MTKLTNGQYRTIVNALRIAVEIYGNDARAMDDAGQPRLARQFYAQQDEARTLADVIEQEAG